MITTTAKIYADALIDKNSTNHINDLEVVLHTLVDNKNLEEVLQNPTISIEQKIEIIDEIFKNHISKEVLNFIKILTEKKHIAELEAIIEILKTKIEENNGIKKVTIISAIKLTKEYQKEITDILSKKLNKKIKPDWQIDETIIAGLIIKIDDDVIDTSVKAKLDKIKGNL